MIFYEDNLQTAKVETEIQTGDSELPVRLCQTNR